MGFVLITNHRVAPDLIETVFSLSHRFFWLPLDQKLLIDKRNTRHFRGWEPEGAESTNNRPDLREQIDLWSEHPARDPLVQLPYLRLLGPNQWLPEAILPGFRTTLGQWFTDLGRLADDLIALLARGLALPDDHFETLFGAERMSFTKLIRYPATPPGG
ncbi:MAG: 2-oxoglutarate and iron-dependent oxygenase domain-containing protein, partial [Alphaproteobacteria bacterium]